MSAICDRNQWKMLDYVQQNFAEELTVSQIAEAAFVSKRECLRNFRSMLHQSPMQYVKEWRVEQSKKLLVETSFSIAEIGERCGFHSQSYFTQKFKEYTGQTPGEYRKTIGKMTYDN